MVADPELSIEGLRAVAAVADLAGALRTLRRREARDRGDSPLTYRELAARTGWAHGVIGDYFAGKTLPPTDRLDVLVGLLGATAAETGAFATARDRVEERRRAQPGGDRRARATRTPPAVAPRELPREVGGFTGRDDQLAALDAQLDAEPGGAHTVVVSAVAGTAGVGKTALAVRWAHRVADRFPDGCLYVDLRGYGPGEPVRPEVALAGFLRSLGVPGAELPPEPAELAARYRTLVAARRLLVVLDNARSADQVRPLLPGSSSCFVLVTSRDTLAGLVARDGARRVDLDLLSDADAVTLLRRLIGPRADAQPDATAALARRCARLPLALRVAAELVVSRPAASVADLVDELGDAATRLDLFDAGGDPDTAVREIFSWSCRHLSDGAARLFRLLGVHPGADVDATAAAALAAVPVAEAARLLDELARAHLVTAVSPGRHGMHDLLRAYAAELAARDDADGADDRDRDGSDRDRAANDRDRDGSRGAGSALDRLLDHYVATAAAATATLYPAERGARGPNGRAPRFATAADATAWLTAELPNLVAVADAAATHGRPGHAGALSESLWRWLDSGGRHAEALRVHAAARDAARAAGDAAAEAAALAELGRAHGRLGRYDDALTHLQRSLGLGAATPDRHAGTLNSIAVVLGRLGRYDDAIEHFTRALASYRATGNRVSEGKTLGNLGIVNAELGRLPRAREHFEQALALARLVGDRIGEGDALNNLAHVHWLLGRYDDALAQHTDGLAIAREAGDRTGESRMLTGLGQVRARLGDPAGALACFEAALRIQRDDGDLAAQAETLTCLAELRDGAGDHAAALRDHDAAFAIARDLGERSAQARALNGAGAALRALGRADDALARHRAARDVADAIGDKLQHARALDGIGRCVPDPALAAACRDEASALFAELGVPAPAAAEA